MRLGAHATVSPTAFAHELNLDEHLGRGAGSEVVRPVQLQLVSERRRDFFSVGMPVLLDADPLTATTSSCPDIFVAPRLKLNSSTSSCTELSTFSVI